MTDMNEDIMELLKKKKESGYTSTLSAAKRFVRMKRKVKVHPIMTTK